MFTLNCKGSLRIIEEPQVMGIINSTPDSFYDKSRTANILTAIELAEKMVQEGVSIIDIGGQSTRPNAAIIEPSDEIDRVIPIIEAIHAQFPNLLISIDSFRPEVAKTAVLAGASIVNDISGGQFFPEMIPTIASLKVPYICMHCANDINKMHEKINYPNITESIIDYYKERLNACKKAGIMDVIIDPGFGFGKTMQDNFKLMNELECLSVFNVPILVGVSRKSMIYKTLQIEASESLNGTTVLNTVGLLKGASILRVHDVKEAKEAIQLVQQLHPKRN
jgi:dihydropteroate synthase